MIEKWRLREVLLVAHGDTVVSGDKFCMLNKYAVIVVQRQLLWSLKVRFRKYGPLSSFGGKENPFTLGGAA